MIAIQMRDCFCIHLKNDDCITAAQIPEVYSLFDFRLKICIFRCLKLKLQAYPLYFYLAQNI